MIGYADITGHADANSTVKILKGDGTVLATTRADAEGTYSVARLSLPVGVHRIHAVTETDHGKKGRSPVISVDVYDPAEVEAGDDDDAIAASLSDDEFDVDVTQLADDELPELTAEEEAESHARVNRMIAEHEYALEQYRDFVAGSARGMTIDEPAALEVLRAAGKTLDDYSADLDAFYEAEREQEHLEQQAREAAAREPQLRDEHMRATLSRAKYHEWKLQQQQRRAARRA